MGINLAVYTKLCHSNCCFVNLNHWVPKPREHILELHIKPKSQIGLNISNTRNYLSLSPRKNELTLWVHTKYLPPHFCVKVVEIIIFNCF